MFASTTGRAPEDSVSEMYVFRSWWFDTLRLLVSQDHLDCDIDGFPFLGMHALLILFFPNQNLGGGLKDSLYFYPDTWAR